MSLMEQFADPKGMHALTFGEKMAGAGITTLMGMGITFAVLILLWGCIALMNKITAKSQIVTAPPSTAATGVVVEDKREIAVVMAAIAAYESGTIDNLVIRKISRIPGSSSAWASAGRAESLRSSRK